MHFYEFFSFVTGQSTKSITRWGPKLTKAPRNHIGKYFKAIVEAQTILNEPLITLTKTDLPIVVEPVEAHIDANDNPLWLIM